ncbi:hypothetical protein QCA50_018069 [Cerrena zonata]|uniref:Uncharacterized protein n=1 Tax=Cerrena zonata TaxID=2478898 RepID=A0AAW0FHC6_9APHY
MFHECIKDGRQFLPGEYQSKLMGATVIMMFSLVKYIISRNTDQAKETFCANIEQIHILTSNPTHLQHSSNSKRKFKFSLKDSGKPCPEESPVAKRRKVD